MDAETEEDEEGHDMLTALPWGTQESGARGLRMGVRAGGDVTSGTADGRGAEPPWGAKRTRWEKGRPSGLVM